VRRTDDHFRVRVERGARWLLEQYRSQGAQALVNRARLVTAQMLIPPPVTLSEPRSVTPRAPVAPRDPEEQPQDVLTGMCADLALRDLNLVDSLLALLENLEANEVDPDALARLYQLDHLATRLRRNAENLRVLAGKEAGGAATRTSSLVDVLRAAMSSIEQYTRIEIGWVAVLGVVDFAGDDVSRLLAELLDNATAYSPPTSPVTVSAHLTERWQRAAAHRGRRDRCSGRAAAPTQRPAFRRAGTRHRIHRAHGPRRRPTLGRQAWHPRQAGQAHSTRHDRLGAVARGRGV